MVELQASTETCRHKACRPPIVPASLDSLRCHLAGMPSQEEVSSNEDSPELDEQHLLLLQLQALPKAWLSAGIS